MKNVALLILVFLLIITKGHAQNRSSADFRYDIKYLKDTLPAKHPNLFFTISKRAFDASLDSISDRVDEMSDFEIIMSLREVVARIGDPHTNFGFYEAINTRGHFPIEVFWFSDDIYIMGCQKGYEAALGKKLVAINDVDIATVVDKVSRVVPKTRPYFSQKRMHYFLVLSGILEYYGITKGDSAKFTVQSANGSTNDMMINVAKNDYEVDGFAYYDNKEMPFYWQRVQSDNIPFFRERYFEKDSIYFIQYNRCWSKELENKYGNEEEAEGLPSFEEFKRKVFETMNTKPVKKVLFDMRFNGGGNSIQGTEFINTLAKLDHVNQTGRLYVGISSHTFSSAVINSMDFRLNTNAILIGTSTGGSPNHYGEVRALVLPKTQLEVYHSTRYFKYIEEEIDTVVPDVAVTNSFEGFNKRLDPLYEYVKKRPIANE